MIVIRAADLDKDALSIFDGAKDFASRISLNDLFPDNDADFLEALSRIVTLPGIEITLAEFDGKVVGGIGIAYAPYIWNPKKLAADELFWWTSLDAPFRTAWLLFDEAMTRIEEKQAIPMFRALEDSPQGVVKMYHRRGLRKAETLFVGA